MMLKRVYLSLASCLLMTGSYSQKARDQSHNVLTLYTTYHHSTNMIQVVPTYRLQGKRRHSHELGIVPFYSGRWQVLSEYNQQIYTIDSRQSAAAVFYQLGYNWYQRPRFAAYVTGSLRIEGYTRTTDPSAPNNFKRKLVSTEIFSGLVPGMRVSITDQLNVDISTVLDLYYSGWYFQRVYNPVIPLRQQKWLSTERAGVPLSYVRVRAGIAYRW